MEEPTSEITITQPGRRIVVEPVVILMAFFGFPLIIISQLYILETINEDLISKNGIANISHDINTSMIDLCALNASDPLVAFNAEVQEAASYFALIATVCSCVPALIVSLFLGAYSDKAGRKYAIIPPLIAGTIKTIIFLIIVMFKLPIWYLWIAFIVDGCGGYYTSMLMGCFAYISDTTTKEQRRFRITVLEICLMLPGILGPLGAGKLLETIGFLYCFLITLAGQIITLLYAIFFIPETIQKDPSARFFDLKHLTRVSAVFRLEDSTNRGTKLIILLVAFFVSIIPNFDFSLDTLFIKNRPLCMHDDMVGYYSATYLGGATLGGLIVAWLLKYCLTDQGVAMLAGLASVAKNIYKAFVINILMIFMTPLFGMFSLLYIPSIRSLMSTMVTDAEQGALFGAIACVEIVCSIIGTSIFNPIYASTQDVMTGFVYLTMAAFSLVGCGILLAFMVYGQCEKRQPRGYSTVSENTVDYPEERGLLDDGSINRS